MAYYEGVSAGLGLNFIDEVELTVCRILLNPEAWMKVSDNHRRCRTRRFPYGLIYTFENDAILVTAVMNLHQHPDSWKSRI